ncbi:MAG: TolC family protein [bacterium]|jgi:outer membrane protein TolC
MNRVTKGSTCGVIAVTLAIFMLLVLVSRAAAAETVLDAYIRQALDSNLALRQQDFSYEKSVAELHEARGLFLPSLDILGRYTRAEGGRAFEFPVGDMVNPIHDALNQLTGEERFPTDVPNQNITFLREREHETKLEVIQPIFQPAVYYNYRLRANLKDVEKAARDQFKHDLVMEVRRAYFDYLGAAAFVDLAARTEDLLVENLRVSQSLFDNGQATRDVVYRAQAELSRVRQSRADAEKGEYLARAYFNFLLNRPQDEHIDSVTLPDELPDPPLTLSQAIDRALEKRLEVVQIEKGIEGAGNAVKLARTGYVPGLTFAFDYGFEGEDFRISGEDDFWTASLVLNWNLFDGLQREARVSRAQAEKNRLYTRKDEIEQQMELEVRDAHRSLVVAKQNVGTSADEVRSARQSFEIVSRKFEEGVASQVEFIDARTAMTRAETNEIVAVYNYLRSYAEFERVTALYPIPEDD